MKQLTVIQVRCGLFETKNINNFNKGIIVRQVIIYTRDEGKPSRIEILYTRRLHKGSATLFFFIRTFFIRTLKLRFTKILRTC